MIVHNGALVMLGIKLREGCEILNQPLKDLCGPDDPYHVVAIKRGTDTIIPGGNDSLQLYDLAYFMTTKQYIPYIRKIVGKEHYVDVKNVMIMGVVYVFTGQKLRVDERTDAETCEKLLLFGFNIFGVVNLCDRLLCSQSLGQHTGCHVKALIGCDGNEQVCRCRSCLA